MNTRNTIILLLALFAGTAFAQAPVIDSMLIDESKGILSVYGDFGTAQGKVWCDSVELPVLTWSASLVTATIPDTGKGSAGPVEIEGSNGEVGMKILTSWKFTFGESTIVNHPGGGQTEYSSSSSFFFRFSIECKILNHSFLTHMYSLTTVDFEKKYILHPPHRQNTIRIEFDSIFQISPYRYYSWGPNGVHHEEFVYDNMTLFPPRNSIAVLVNSTKLSLPDNNRVEVDPNNCNLLWTVLKYMDAYHIQLSKDSLINGQRAGQAQQGFTYVVDTIATSLEFTLPPLEKNTKYYWRVCGVNTEGESRWSEVWSFTTGTSTDVKHERAKSVSLACYPNPAMNELTIVTTEPTRLLLYDVTGKIIKSEQATTNQTKWDVSLLPNGTYILGTSRGEMQVVQIVK